MADGEYQYLGQGDGLTLEVHGPTVESCLARAVEGFIAAFSDVHPSLIGSNHEVEVAGNSADALLLGALEEALRLGRSGQLAVAATAARIIDGRAILHLEAVPADVARASGIPALLSWEEVRLERDDGLWRGRIVCHLAPNPESLR